MGAEIIGIIGLAGDEVDARHVGDRPACLDDDKMGRMGLWTPPTDEYWVLRKAEAENLSNDGAIWVTSPWKPSYLGYIG